MDELLSEVYPKGNNQHGILWHLEVIDRSIHFRKSIMIPNSNKNHIEFDPLGKICTILMKRTKKLQIYSIENNDLEDLMDRMNTKDDSNALASFKDDGFANIRDIKFD